MRVYDIIKKKRDGNALTKREIDFFVSGYARGEIPDYQAAAFCMAVYFKGMTLQETTDFTLAIRDSGKTLDFSAVNGIRADKHSTGGVGDKTSLVVAPIVASLGVKVAKMSGRGLGHTGGTVDKLESIPGFRAELSEKEFIKIVNEVGVCIVGQSRELAPADKKFYALRDVTATVDSIPLIASSIMGKKLAADDDCIVLDVKTGSGAFMKTIEESRALAKVMVGIGKKAGKRTVALITDMDQPLGKYIGNSLEVREAVKLLHVDGEQDFKELCIALSAEMLYLADKGSLDECKAMAIQSLESGKALATFRAMVKAQGGDVSLVDDPWKVPEAKYFHYVLAPENGYITALNAEGYGLAALTLGAGRNKVGDKIDYTAGIVMIAKKGDMVERGDWLAMLYSNDKTTFEKAEEIILGATEISNNRPQKRPVVLERIE